jgi:hypothetical protein
VWCSVVCSVYCVLRTSYIKQYEVRSTQYAVRSTQYAVYYLYILLTAYGNGIYTVDLLNETP